MFEMNDGFPDEKDDPTSALLGVGVALPEGDWTDGTVDELALRLARIDDLLGVLRRHRDEIELALAERMETDEMSVGYGLRLFREYKGRSESWDTDGVRRAVQEAATGKIALDPATGELMPERRWAAGQAFEWVFRTWSVGKPKVGRDSGFRALGLDPDEFRATGAVRYAVKAIEQGEAK